MSEDPRLVAKYRVPIDAKNVGRLARTLSEYPAHELTIEGPFLVVREVTA